MPIRAGSLGAELERLDPDVLEQLLADYEQSEHRAHCSRKDFAAGWLAHARRVGSKADGHIERIDWSLGMLVKDGYEEDGPAARYGPEVEVAA